MLIFLYVVLVILIILFLEKKPSSFFFQSQRNYAELKEVAAEEDLEDYIA